jgi:DNA-binding FrmR family transcriptional regulator
MKEGGANHKSQLNRIKRIEGQVRGVGQMIEKQEYCIPILGQIRAIRGALQSLELKILECHMHHCVEEGLNSDNPDLARERIDEVLELLKKSVR